MISRGPFKPLSFCDSVSATKSRFAPWCECSSLICLTHITDCIIKTEQSFDLKEIFSETNVCTEKSKWGPVKAKIWYQGNQSRGFGRNLSPGRSVLLENCGFSSQHAGKTSMAKVARHGQGHPAWAGHGHAWTLSLASWVLSRTSLVQAYFHWLHGVLHQTPVFQGD